MADEPRGFDPSEVEVNRGREQGLGVGARELARQHDPEQAPQTPLELDNDDAPGKPEAPS